MLNSLESLEIKNFRSLVSFQVKKLGQVNLIVGKNNSGKSSVLEALRIYAGSANRKLLERIAQSHNEKYRFNEGEELSAFDAVLPFEDFFTGRKFPKNDDGIAIGSIENEKKRLNINHAFLIEKEETTTDESGEEITRISRVILKKLELNVDSEFSVPVENVLVISKNNNSSILDLESTSRFPSRRHFGEIEMIPCSVIPTQFISMDELAAEWDAISLTEGEDIVKEALQIVLPEFEDLTFIDDASSHNLRKNNHRLAKVKISNLPRPVPLNSLGDGMLRILQLVLKVFSAKNGFLLIDEFENGLHYSVQEKVWALLFKLSKKLNIQIFATTHSWDCIESFSKVACENKNIEGVLFRVGKSVRESEKGHVIATVFDENQLYNITQSDVEVR
ncbi:MAG: AAA family ATPase [Thiomicrorhabdus sp.]|nr:AAA family ATPase [Thiomicrorhabdus sp.]